MADERPRVRVVVLNYNGGSMTLECLRSVLATQWPTDRLQVILVDNSSTDDVVETVRAELPNVEIRISTTNRGFAGGNNLALHDLTEIDYLALVNNDAVVDPDWLAPLVETLEHDPDLGAACPKILLEDRYVEISLDDALGDASADAVIVGARVDDVDIWSRSHVAIGNGAFAVSAGSTPARNRRLRVPAPRHDDAVAEVGLRTESSELRWVPIAASGPQFDVINNVGNVLLKGGYGADRGYLERDDGQFDRPEEVFAWCGAAVLLRCGYLEDVGLFDERLFLYYEDLELSWRGRRRGWRFRSVPRSVVRHRHGATSVTGSETWHYFNSRNRLLVLTRHATWHQLFGALARQVLVTARSARARTSTTPTSYPAPSREVLHRRGKALLGYLRLAPAMLLSRLRDRLRPNRSG